MVSKKQNAAPTNVCAHKRLLQLETIFPDSFAVRVLKIQMK